MSNSITTEDFSRPRLGLRPSRFLCDIQMFPDITFSVQSTKIPAVTLGVASQENPLQTLYVPGDKLQYQPLPMRLIVDEQLIAYTKLYGWMRGLAFPTMTSDSASAIQSQSRLKPSSNLNMPTTELFLMVLNSNNNPVAKVTFTDAFPIYLGDLTFDTTEDGSSYIYVDVEFRYNYFMVDMVTG